VKCQKLISHKKAQKAQKYTCAFCGYLPLALKRWTTRPRLFFLKRDHHGV